ncbi:MAG: DUF2127 domain-containing protein [Bacillota bacterium]|nr:DUF2127 domain-containing protein [Bacillota bacterium]
MKKYKAAAILMIIHGGLMELSGVFFIFFPLIFDSNFIETGKYFSFKLSYFQENMNMMIIMGVIYGIMRLTGAIGLLKNRMWGLALSVINSVATIIVMMFMLPAGIADGILAGSALVLMLTQYYGDKKIIE